jgi:hypothetical protein
MLRFTLAVLLAATASAATPDNVSSRLMVHVSTYLFYTSIEDIEAKHEKRNVTQESHAWKSHVGYPYPVSMTTEKKFDAFSSLQRSFSIILLVMSNLATHLITWYHGKIDWLERRVPKGSVSVPARFFVWTDSHLGLLPVLLLLLLSSLYDMMI